MRTIVYFFAGVFLFGCGGLGASSPPLAASPFVGHYGGLSANSQAQVQISNLTISATGAFAGKFSFLPTWFPRGTTPTNIPVVGTITAQISSEGILTGTSQVSGQSAAPLYGSLAPVPNGNLSGSIQWDSFATFLVLSPCPITPTVTSISPNPVTKGGNVCIAGSNLGGSATLVHFPTDEAHASFYATSGNSSRVVAPIRLSPGVYEIAVTTSNNQSTMSDLSNTVTLVVR